MDDNGTYLGNIYGIYKACIANISIDIYDIKYKIITHTHRRRLRRPPHWVCAGALVGLAVAVPWPPARAFCTAPTALAATWQALNFDSTLGFPGEGPGLPGTPFGGERPLRRRRSRSRERGVSSPPLQRAVGPAGVRQFVRGSDPWISDPGRPGSAPPRGQEDASSASRRVRARVGDDVRELRQGVQRLDFDEAMPDAAPPPPPRCMALPRCKLSVCRRAAAPRLGQCPGCVQPPRCALERRSRRHCAGRLAATAQPHSVPGVRSVRWRQPRSPPSLQAP